MKVAAGFQREKWVQVFNLHMQLLRDVPQVENLRPLLFRRLKTCGHLGKPAATHENLRPLMKTCGHS
jgi:hypothetical protein